MASLPVISNISTEISELHESWVFERPDYESFKNACLQALQKELLTNEAMRTKFLSAQAIDIRVEQILEKLRERRS